MKAEGGKRKKARMVREEAVGYGGAIVLYRAPDGTVSLDVRIEKETLWLSQKQMAELFATERSVVTKHLGNIFQSGELERAAVCANFAHTAPDGKTYGVDFFNLDAVISVGYRVNSKRGTQFRIWAPRVLRDHILKGYSVNERRLKELRQSLRLVGQVLDRYDVSSDQAKALLRVVTDYERALDILDDYDHQRTRPVRLTRGEAVGIEYAEAIAVIEQMRVKFGGSALFGREKDDSLRSSLSAVMQTFDGRDVYPSLEEKAAHLLYFLVKNHSFVDGNKRIAAALFLWFMEKNHLLYRADGSKRVADNALVAITLMVAESKADQKTILTTIIAHLIHEKD
jgi:prophage maintenance system killer protein